MNALYAVAAVLVAIWIASFLVYKVSGGLIHLLLVFAVIMVVLRLFTGRKV